MKKIIQQALKLGIKLLEEDKLIDAEVILKQLIKTDSKNAKAYHVLGLLNLKKRKAKQALEYFKKAIEFNPKNAENYNNASLCYISLNDADSAIECSKKAIALDPKPLYYNNLALHFRHKGEYKNAIINICYSLGNDYNNAQTWANGGNIYILLKNLGMSEFFYNQAIELEPNNLQFQNNLANVYFLNGEWEKGWPLYEHRLENFEPALHYSKLYGPNKWTGQPLERKKIVIYCEQGHGDFLHFSRYIPKLIDLGCQVSLHVSKDIKLLFEENFNLIIQTEKIEEYDYHCSVASLPCYLKIPIPNSHIKCNKLGNYEKYKTNFKIGINWAGNPLFPNDRLRSCALSYFKKIHDIPNVKLFSLQKDTRPRAYHSGNEVDLAGGCEDMRIVNLSEYVNDFSDTAAFINGLDLIISVDTSVLHLAGSMGKLTYALIPFNPDWRWKLEGENTVWYPSVKLFRQDNYGDWNSAFEKIYKETKREIVKHLVSSKVAGFVNDDSHPCKVGSSILFPSGLQREV
jgi:tetratricopeptide (TPR) repeat protein